MVPFVTSSRAPILLRRLFSGVAHPVAKKTMSEADVAVTSPVANDTNKAVLFVSKKVALEAAHPVAQDAKKGKDARSLLRQLTSLGKAGEGSVSRLLNKWVREGRETRVADLGRCIRELRKYKRHAQALELMDWMVHTKGMNMSHTNHAIHVDLIHKVRGIEEAKKCFDGLPDPAKNHQPYGALLNCYCSLKKEFLTSDSAYLRAEDVKNIVKKGTHKLYWHILGLREAGDGSISRLLNNWVLQGRETRKVILDKCVMKLRSLKRHTQALEV